MKPLVLIATALCMACGAAPQAGGSGQASGVRYYRIVTECWQADDPQTVSRSELPSCGKVSSQLMNQMCDVGACGQVEVSQLLGVVAKQSPKPEWRSWRLIEWVTAGARRPLPTGDGWKAPLRRRDLFPPRVGRMARQVEGTAAARLLTPNKVVPAAWAGVASPRPLATAQPVHVAVIDTAGSDRRSRPAGSHGADLAALLQNGLCGRDAGCVPMSFHQALDLRPDRAAAAAAEPWATPGQVWPRRLTGYLPATRQLSGVNALKPVRRTRKVRGRRLEVPGGQEAPGAFGDPGQVARAVWEATAMWQARGARDQQLVLVLPLGWQLPTSKPDLWSAGTRAARAVITHAEAQGAHVVLAYGNRDLAGGVGPLAPAAFFNTSNERGDRVYVVGGVQASLAPPAGAPRPEQPANPAPEPAAPLACGQSTPACALCAPGTTAAGLPCCPRAPKRDQVAALVNQRPWRARSDPAPEYWAWGDGVPLAGRAAWAGTSTAATVFAAAVVRALVAKKGIGAWGTGWVRACDGDGTCATPAAKQGELRPPVDPLPTLKACREPAPRKPALAQGGPPAPAGAGLERVDPQPDDPVCDVCSLVQLSGNQAKFKLQALSAGWPASDEVFSSFELKITYTDGTPAHYVSVGPFTSGADYRHEMDSSSEMVSDTVTLSGPYTKIDAVTLVGTVDHYTYKSARTVFEPVDVP